MVGHAGQYTQRYPSNVPNHASRTVYYKIPCVNPISIRNALLDCVSLLYNKHILTTEGHSSMDARIIFDDK